MTAGFGLLGLDSVLLGLGPSGLTCRDRFGMGRIVGFEPWLSGLVLDPVLSGLVYRAWVRFCRFWFAGFGFSVAGDWDVGIGGIGLVRWCRQRLVGCHNSELWTYFAGCVQKGVCGLGFVILKTLIFQRF